jgi:hypothetical protein
VLAAVSLVAVSVGGTLGAERSVSASGCPAGQVSTLVLGRSGCSALRVALPRPRSGDRRVALIDSALTSTLAGSAANAPPSVARLIGPSAHGEVERGLHQTLGRLDRLVAPRATQALQASPVGCAPHEPVPAGQTVPSQSQTFHQDLGGGSSLDTQVHTGKAGAGFGMRFESTKDGKTLRVDVEYTACEFDVPSCPTAQGVVLGTDTSSTRVTTLLLKGGRVEYSATTRLETTTKLTGQTADDAKLDTLDIDTTEKQSANTGGSARWLSGGTSANVTRHTLVDMRSGSYDPGRGSLGVTQSFHGPLSGLVDDSTAKAAAAEAIQRATDTSFATLVGKSIDEYRTRERAWQAPNSCASLGLAPPSSSLTLKAGDHGKVTGMVDAKRGGNASGHWKVVAHRNATFSPESVDGAEATFAYHVTRATATVPVSATFEVRSRAGVATDTWQQGGADVELPDAYVGHTEYTLADTYEGITDTFTAHTTFTLRASTTHTFPSYTYREYKLVSAATEFDHTVQGACYANGNVSYSLGPGPVTLDVMSAELAGARDHERTISYQTLGLSGLSAVTLTLAGTISGKDICDPYSFVEGVEAYAGSGWWGVPTALGHPVSPTARSLEGSYDAPGPSGTETQRWSWTITAQ